MPVPVASTAPATKWVAITLSDTVAVDPNVRSIVCVNQDATISIEDGFGNQMPFYATRGTVIPCKPRFVRSTGTTASSQVWGLI